MNEIYIKKEDVNRWIGKFFENKDLISIDDLIAVIEDLDGDLESLKEKYEELDNDFYEYRQDNPPRY